jgi:hypothetical protein
MRRKIRGFIFQFTSADHGGRHIHVFKDNAEIGVFDRADGPVRGLENKWSRDLQEALAEFIRELHARGFFL